jgi:hypothetical protein
LNRDVHITGSRRVFASVHMRMGDACDVRLDKARPYIGIIWGTLNKNKKWGDRPCVVPSGYEEPLKKMKQKYGVTDILLATDSPEAITWAKAYTDLPVITLTGTEPLERRGASTEGCGSKIDPRIPSRARKWRARFLGWNCYRTVTSSSEICAAFTVRQSSMP